MPGLMDNVEQVVLLQLVEGKTHGLHLRRVQIRPHVIFLGDLEVLAHTHLLGEHIRHVKVGNRLVQRLDGLGVIHDIGVIEVAARHHVVHLEPVGGRQNVVGIEGVVVEAHVDVDDDIHLRHPVLHVVDLKAAGDRAF